MAIEIERKFLVVSDEFKIQAMSHFTIIQGFLNRDPERTVRVRLMDQSGLLTVKGLGSKSGLSRFEWETTMSREETLDLLKLCEPGIIQKERFIVPYLGCNYEVDVFELENSGLILAELELEYENAPFEKPDWLGEEVTGDIRYYNSYLSEKPFSHWKD